MSSPNLRRELSKLLGASASSSYPFYRVVIATTMWSDMAPANRSSDSEYLVQAGREISLKWDYWALLEKQGATVRRHENTPECAAEIIQSILDVRRTPLNDIILFRWFSGRASRRKDYHCTKSPGLCVCDCHWIILAP